MAKPAIAALRIRQASLYSVTASRGVIAVEFLGSILRIKARVAGTQVALDTFNRADAPPPAVGVETSVSFSARDLVVLNA